MKSLFLSLATLLLVFSCAKKAETKGPTSLKEKLNSPSQDEVNFNVLRELKLAILDNDVQEAQSVFSQKIPLELNEIQTDGETFLTYTIKNDMREMRNLLIQNGASLEAVNAVKETPLLAASSTNSLNSVLVLLKKNVELEKRNQNGDTALHVAIKNSYDNVALTLIQNDARIETVDRSGKNSLILAQEYNVPKTLEYIQKLLHMEPDVDKDKYHQILVDADHVMLSSVLAANPTLATDPDYEALNPFAILVDNKMEEKALKTAEVLVKYKAKINGPENAEIVPLIKATKMEKESLTNYYLSQNADTELKDHNGKSALIYAVELNNSELVDMLIKYNASIEYTYKRKNGKKVTVNACKVANRIGKNLESKEEVAKNETIKKALDCRLLDVVF